MALGDERHGLHHVARVLRRPDEHLAGDRGDGGGVRLVGVRRRGGAVLLLLREPPPAPCTRPPTCPRTDTIGRYRQGYLTTQVLGGWLAARWNGWGVLALAVFGYSVATLLTPLAAATSLPTLIACRVLLGMGEGCTLPALHHVTARWAPANERARFVTISVSGQYLGTSATLLCAPLVHVWWPSIFYIFGGLGICWVVAWVLLVIRTNIPGFGASFSEEPSELFVRAGR